MELRSVSPLKPGEANQAQEEERKIRKISQEFEAIFLSFMLKGMRKSVPEGGVLSPGAVHDLYRQMFDEEIGRSLAKSGGVGLADVIYRELSTNIRRISPPARDPGQGIPLGGPLPSDEGR